MQVSRSGLTRSAVVAAFLLVAIALAPANTMAANPPTDAVLDVYIATVTRAGLDDLLEEGRDIGHVIPRADGRFDAEIVLTQDEYMDLLTGDPAVPVRRWLTPEGLTFSQQAELMQQQGYVVFRSYDEPGGILDETTQMATDHPTLVKRLVIGTTVQDRPIIALKITSAADTTEDGSKDAVLYSSVQHAREWIAVEVNRRLAHYVVDNYGTDPEITQLLDTTELWFIFIANPDGYQYTFDQERLWRKNMRDLEGDGQITGREGIDLNRNFDAHWGYDVDGSSGAPQSDTYRGPEPASEPETRAMQDLLQNIDFTFQVNYHSAASLILYGTGWQDLTYTPDDMIQIALSGNLSTPAIEGFEPMLGSGLYITNGETCDYSRDKAGTLCWTPELTPGNVEDQSGFEFPDDEALIQAEFEKNIPFALDVAKSAADPERPVSHLGNTTSAFYVDSFAYSHGTRQPVATWVRRSLGDVTLHYLINGGDAQTATTAEFTGGERFGADGMNHYREVRGEVAGASPGDTVTAWFTAGGEVSDTFQYAVEPVVPLEEPPPSPFPVPQHESGHHILVVAAEDYTGITPDAADKTAPRYAADYMEAVRAAGYEPVLYDVDAHGREAPHALGVLSHYDLVLWYTGDDQVPRADGMVQGTVSRQAARMMTAIRQFMNEGGKVVHAGRYAGMAYFSGLEYDPVADAPCNPQSGSDGCFALENDFYQYYIGVDGYQDAGVSTSGALHPVVGQGVFDGLTLDFTVPVSVTEHAGMLTPTSSRMPAEGFPQFDSATGGYFFRPGDAPHGGDYVVHSGPGSWNYKRLARTIDLTSVPTTTLSFWTSYDVRPQWDAVFVEAHEVGQADWTTLPDLNGHTQPGEGASHCQSRNYTDYPQLQYYMTAQGEGQQVTCVMTGTTGAWYPSQGGSGGEWENWTVDLARWNGKQVEVSISYLSSRIVYPGIMVDDVTLPDGSTTSFEEGMGGWVAIGPPDGADAPDTDFSRMTAAEISRPTGGPIVTAADSVMFGFDLSSVADVETRGTLLWRAFDYLGLEPATTSWSVYLPALKNE